MFAKNSLGIYLTSKKASLVEIKGKRTVRKHTFIFDETALILKPEDEIIKRVAFFQEALRDSQIETKECFVGFSSEDLVIRSFIISVLPSKEIPSAINFEVKRYIPSSIVEELIFDFQYRPDRLTKKIEVVLTGIKKELLKKYNDIFGQLGLKILSIEPGVFSILRLLRQEKKIEEKDLIALVDVNGEEFNFTVILNSFPLFTHQMKIPILKEEEISFKFYSEVRISLDYFRRQFPGKDIKRIFLLAEPQFFSLVEGLETEIDVPVEVLEPVTLLDKKDKGLTVSELKAFGLALRSRDPRTVTINLYKPQALIERPVEVAPPKIALVPITPKVILRPLIVGFFVVLLGFFFGQQKSLPLRRELKDYQTRILSLKIGSPFVTLSDLQNIKMNSQKKLDDIDKETRRLRLKVTPLFNSFPSFIPEELCLERMSLVERELRLSGYAYLEDEKKEFDAVYRFLSSLKKTDIFVQRFKEVRLISITRSKKKEFDITNFEILAKQ